MNAQELDDRLQAATPVVRAAGRLALQYFNDRAGLAIEHKGQQDLVSIADRAVEDLIRGELAKLIRRALELGKGGTGFTHAEAFDAVPATVIVDHIALNQVFESVILPLARAAGYVATTSDKAANTARKRDGMDMGMAGYGVR